MATHLKTVLFTFLLFLIVLMQVKPNLAKRGENLKQKTKKLEESMHEKSGKSIE